MGRWVATWIVTLALQATAAPAAAAETYEYDPAGRLLVATYADGSSLSYTYDPGGNVLAVTSRAAEELQAPAGRKLLLIDDAVRPQKRKLVFAAKDAGLTTPLQDPTLAGGTLVLRDPASGQTDTYPLPAAGWNGMGDPAGQKGYRYVDATLSAGPCKKVMLKAGLLKALCKGERMSFSLEQPVGGSGLAVALVLDGLRYCTVFDGASVLESGTTADTGRGRFRAGASPGGGPCPVP